MPTTRTTRRRCSTRCASFWSGGIEAQYLHKVGHPSAAIAKLAQEGGFDLVVIGSHGQGAFANLVLGSVATQVLASCSVPVLVIR
ncbi:universal stress protein [Variovorax sp. J22R133]|uniref:universal stress protein n=1 Tax=Variovorax brevis TaxID=3053503 RepID=UPI00257530E5|nr:universal stress protein [Variovorax sp. J22R133]MDM0116329.1 universal stress protein [Variovorax sp. J22R133]